MPVTFKQYTDALLQCLGQYQFIEEALRFCLVRCHATTKFRLDGFFPYQAPLQAIEDAALGRLIDWYKTYTNNSELISDLRSIKAARDHIAHRGLALTLEEQESEEFLSQQVTELGEALIRAQDCFSRLMSEMEATDKAVNRAYAAMQAEYNARREPAPPPFKDQPPGPQEN
jgi:hypothetical protein